MLEPVTNPSHEILIVEDNPADARLLEILLDDVGIDALHVTHASRLEEARERLQSKPIDAVLLDLGLPDAEGLEGLSILTRNGAPILVVSGNDDEQVRHQATRLGVVDYLLKDELGPERLGRSLRVALRQSEPHLQNPTGHRRRQRAEPELAEWAVAAASEITALGLRLGGWIDCVEDQQGKLCELLARFRGERKRRGEQSDDLIEAALAVAEDVRQTSRDVREPLSRLMKTSLSLQRAATQTRRRRARAIDTIVEEACHRVAANLVGRRIEITKRFDGADATVADPRAAHEAVECLLRGLAEICLHEEGGGVELTVHTTQASDRVVVSVDVVAEAGASSMRQEALSYIMGSGHEGDPRCALAGTLTSVRQAGGNLRCGSGDDGRLWIEICLPRLRC